MRFAGACIALAAMTIERVSAAPEGTPAPAPAAADAPKGPPPLSIYGRLPQFERAVISPSGARIAMVVLYAQERRLIVVDRENKPLLVQSLGDIKVRGLYWAGEDRVLVKKSDTTGLGIGFTTDKAELYSMIVVPLDGGKVYSVFQHDERIQGGIRGFYGVTEEAGNYYGYFGGITLDGDGFRSSYLTSTKPLLYKVDLRNDRAAKLAPRIETPDDWRDWLVGGDGTVKATMDYHSGDGRWVIRTPAGRRVAEGISPLGGVDLIGFGPAATTVIYSVDDDKGDGERRWFEVPLEGGEAKAFEPAQGMGGTFFDNRTRRMLGYEIAGDVPAYKFFDPRQQKVMDAVLKAFPGRSVHLHDWNDAFDKLIVMTEGPEDPETCYTVDVAGRTADILGSGYEIPGSAVGPMRMIRYAASDGMEIPAVLTLPPGRPAKNLPVIVLPHGGPPSRDYPGFDWWAQAFAARGYAVLQPNFRGSTGYGAAFEKAGHGEWGRKMQTDLSDGLAWLAREGIADPKRACIMGASYGGYAALAGVTLQQGLYRCAVAVAGVSDVARMVTTDITQSGYNALMIRSLRDEVGAHRDLRAVSPVNFAAQADAPVLLIHGKDDTVVQYEQSTAMAAALRRAGKPVDFVTLPGEDHWLSRSATRLAMLEAAVAFVMKHNPPDPAP